MRIAIRLFAIQREQAGFRDGVLDLPDGSTVADAWQRLVADVPALASGTGVVRFAVNARYADGAEPLREGDEVAFIPPVAGGVDRRIELSAGPLGDEILARLRRWLPTDEDGAVVLFVGQTRESPGTPAPGEEAEAARFADREVQELAYEAFEEMALAVIGQIVDEVEQRFGVRRVAVVHRTGVVPLGEASVVIGAAAPHRDAAFQAARYLIDELKARAPIWKQGFADGSVWIGQPARAAPLEAAEEGA
jgi:molybdopterin synthase catalytic subunit